MAIPFSGDLPNPGMEPGSPAVAGGLYCSGLGGYECVLNINKYLTYLLGQATSVQVSIVRTEFFLLLALCLCLCPVVPDSL